MLSEREGTNHGAAIGAQPCHLGDWIRGKGAGMPVRTTLRSRHRAARAVGRKENRSRGVVLKHRRWPYRLGDGAALMRGPPQVV